MRRRQLVTGPAWFASWQRPVAVGCWVFVAALLAVACRPPMEPAPTATPPPILPDDDADTGWELRGAGLARREITAALPAGGLAERLILFRIEPEYFTWRVLYAPGMPRRVMEWDRRARLVFNAGFFDENNAALGLLVSDGRSFGKSYAGFGGMFAVVGGVPCLRSLVAEPYWPGEALEQAVQSFPLLIYPDGSFYSQADDRRARRTVLGQDAAGRLYLVVAPHPVFTLNELATWLAHSDLGLTIALNLDGGGSTGYYAGPADWVDSLTPVPAVIGAYTR